MKLNLQADLSDYTCILRATCCLAIMGSMTSAICLDSLFHLSSFSLWHCWSTRMNISSTCSAREKYISDEDSYETRPHNIIHLIWGKLYLMVLHKSQQHGDHHLFLRIQLFACIRFIWAPQHKQIVNYWLQGRDGCQETNAGIISTFYCSLLLHCKKCRLSSLGVENASWSGSYNEDELLLGGLVLNFNIFKTNVQLCQSYHVWQPSCRSPWCHHTAGWSWECRLSAWSGIAHTTAAPRRKRCWEWWPRNPCKSTILKKDQEWHLHPCQILRSNLTPTVCEG